MRRRPDTDSAARPAAVSRGGRPGARAHRLRWRDRLAAAADQHRAVAAQSLSRMRADPLQSLATMLVVAIALALPATLYLAVDSLQRLAGGLDTGNRMTLYLALDTPASDIEGVRRRLAGHPAVAVVTYVSPEQGLEEFKQRSGFGAALDLLESNPLPPVMMVELRDSPAPGAVKALAAELADWDAVADVELDAQWLARARAIAALGRQLALALGAALAVGVLLIVGNTIRLAVENRRDEILVLKLVGGTDAFVRRPFLYTGLWCGVGGGVLAWLMVAGGRWWLQHPLARLADLYQAQWTLAPIDGLMLLALAGGGGGLGVLGARFAAGRQLRSIAP
jgi:cell division transport system permease protein